MIYMHKMYNLFLTSYVQRKSHKLRGKDYENLSRLISILQGIDLQAKECKEIKEIKQRGG